MTLQTGRLAENSQCFAAWVCEDFRSGNRLDAAEIADLLSQFAVHAGLLSMLDRILKAFISATLNGGAVTLATLNQL